MKTPPGDNSSRAPRATPGRTLQAMLLRRLYYDMQSYQIVREYLATRRRAYHRATRAAHTRLETAHARAVERSMHALDACASEIEMDLRMLEIRVDEEPMKRSLASPFSDSPDYLKSFDMF
jgi:hypothetical protein